MDAYLVQNGIETKGLRFTPLLSRADQSKTVFLKLSMPEVVDQKKRILFRRFFRRLIDLPSQLFGLLVNQVPTVE
jgi:hypothetical protein